MPRPQQECEPRLNTPDGSPGPLGRWATLKDAAGLLDLAPEKVLKQLRQGKRRGTKIGNNWFVYVDPDVQAAAAERRRLAEERRAAGREALETLRRENSALREELAGVRREAPQAARDETLADRLSPLIDGLERHHRGMQAEVEFLRSEMTAMRRQHAEEMQRKDILIQQAHKALQEVVRKSLPAPPPPPPEAPPPPAAHEVNELRREHDRMARVMGQMSELLAVMYRRLRQNDDRKPGPSDGERLNGD